MALDFATLDIKRVIVHDIPSRPTTGASTPMLSDVESPLNDELKLYLKEKITQSATSSAAFDVILDTTSTSPVPNGILSFVTPPGTDFVAFSQQVANHLYQTQTGVNTKGFLVMVDCTIQGCPSLGILKVEREAGIRVAPKEVSGKRTFLIERIRELMLTQGTKVFKVGVFRHRGPGPADLDAVVCDLQRGQVPKYEVAVFFLSRFLGCRLAEAPEITTKRFLESTEAFIRDQVSDPACKARYQIALLAEMNSRQTIISPRAFAGTHLDIEDRKSYMDHLESRHVPNQPIPKDLALVKTRIQRMQMDFASGVSLIAPGDVFSDKIHLTKQENGLTRVDFEDQVSDIRGRR